MKLFLIFFILVAFALAIYTQLPDQNLHIVVCDVGQGDGMLIQKGSTQIVIDAGPDNSILTCLGRYMPFWDRTIEVALMTHADSDHFYGFIEMIERYTVNTFVASTVDNPSSEYEMLKQTLRTKRVSLQTAHAGKRIKVSELIIDIIFPQAAYEHAHTVGAASQNILGSRTSNDRNDICAITRLTYGNFSGLFTCDISPSSGRDMLSLGLVEESYFLKVSHHGSKNGLTEDFLKAVNPQVATISVGRKNRYGHPSPEIMSMLEKANVQTYRTDQDGDIELATDGKRIWIHK